MSGRVSADRIVIVKLAPSGPPDVNILATTRALFVGIRSS